MRRVELTHDVLCSVVLSSRDLRHEREALDQAQRNLEAQKAREAAIHKALVRARQIALGCAVLAIVAVASAFFGYQNMRRAQEAETKAQQTRLRAAGARSEAEKLIVYLLDDFYLELEPIGRLDIVADLAKRALDYYGALPPELRTAETDGNRALGLVRYGYVLRYQGKLDEGLKVLSEAVEVLSRLRREGDRSEVTAIGLGLGLSASARVLDSQSKELEAGKRAGEAVELLTPLMAGPSPSVALRRAYGATMLYLGFTQMRQSREEESVKTLEGARAAFRSIDGLSLGDLPSAAAYAEASSWLVEALTRLGRSADAKKIGEEAEPVASRILERRPNHMGALRSRALILGGFVEVEINDLHRRKALAFAEAVERDWESFLKLDPGNFIAWSNLAGSRSGAATSLEALGRPNEALRKWRTALDVERDSKSPALAGNLIFPAGRLAELEADLNIPRPDGKAPGDHRRLADIAVRALPRDSFTRLAFLEFGARFDFISASFAGRYAEVRALTEAALRRIEAAKPSTENESRQRSEGMAFTSYYLASALYNLKEYAEAEKASRSGLGYRDRLPNRTMNEKIEASRERLVLAMAVARQNRQLEAWKIVEPELKFHREAAGPGSDDLYQRSMLARAQFAAALAAPQQAPILLAEAAAIIDGLPKEMSRRNSIAQLRGWIAEEIKKRRS